MKATTKNQWQALLFSTGGILAVGVLLVAVNMIAGEVNLRADFTEENLYTLSQGSREILGDLETPVDLRFYYSKSTASMPVQLKNYARRVQDLLQEYRRASGGMLKTQKFDPEPDSDAEDAARLDGIRGQTVGALGERIYLGVAVHCLDSTAALPYLDPGREAQLEYDLTRAIYRVTHPEKPTAGLISSLPVAGRPMNPMMMRQPSPDNQPWVLMQELEKQFEVRELSNPEQIPSDVDVLLLIHPKGLSDSALFAVDQYLLGGGRILAFLDPMSLVGQQLNPQERFGQPQPSDLGPLLPAWGLEFDTDSVVIDRLYKFSARGPDGQMQDYLPFLDLGPETVSPDNPAVAELERILLPFAGHFEGEAAEGLTRTVLLHTSEKSGTIPKFMTQVGGDQLAKNIENEGGEKALAVQLRGRFETAFPEGQPAAEGDDSDETAPAEEDSLKKSMEESTVVLVADADMLHDRFCVNQRRTLFGPVAMSLSDNLALAQNLTELLGGASALIGIRSRGALNRPFEVIQKETAEARAKYDDKIAELEAELAEAESRLQRLQEGKSENDRYFLSPEQEKEIRRFKEKRAAVNRELKELRRTLRKEIDNLENGLKWFNIAAMPVLVILGGLGVSLHRKRRMNNQ